MRKVFGGYAAYLVSRYKVPHEKQNAHDNMLSHWDDIRARYLEWTVEARTKYNPNTWSYLQDLDTAVNSSVQVNVIGSNTSSDANFEILRLPGERYM